MLTRLASALIITLARTLTGVRAIWLVGAPQSTPTVYFANHRSHGDFVLLWSSLPPDLRSLTRPVAAADYWLASPTRRFIGCDVFRAVLIDRTGAGDRGDPITQMATALDAGDSLILFPEGTRNESDEALLPFKSGLFHLARRCPNARLVPTWINNVHRVLPKGAIVPLPLACSVTFGAPVQAPDAEGTDAKQTFLSEARAALLALRPEYDRET
jgi:1-acyl-sn-glycerol-3-phosphate acyltransferase